MEAAVQNLCTHSANDSIIQANDLNLPDLIPPLALITVLYQTIRKEMQAELIIVLSDFSCKLFDVKFSILKIVKMFIQTEHFCPIGVDN